MNLPNQLTVARLVLTALFVAAMSLRHLPHHYTLAFVLFVSASITDFLDGHIARKHNLITDFGKLMDPLADKILTGAVFILLSAEGVMPAWCTILIISREFLVTGLRMLASSEGAILAADRFGKWKTVTQIVTACYLMAGRGLEEPALSVFSPLYSEPLHWLGGALIAITVALTVFSGLSYLMKNRSLIRDL